MPEEKLKPQCALPFETDERGLREQICLLTGRPVSLSVTSNRVSVLSVRKGKNPQDKGFCFLSGRRSPETISLRLHRIFLKAGPEVIREVARFIMNGKKGVRFPLLGQFIKENEAELKKPVPGRKDRLLRTLGRFHNLREIYDSLNMEYFEGRLACHITWGKRPPSFVSGKSGAVRKRTLGSFSPFCDGTGAGLGLIRINPVLDRKKVPSYYVRFVVYHEMLHADMGVGKGINGRRRIHPPLFKKRESLFRDFERATAFEKGGEGP